LLAAAAAALSAQKSPFCQQSLPPLYPSTNGLPSSFMSLPNPLQTLLLPMAAELAGTAPMAMKTPVIGQTADEVKKTIVITWQIKYYYISSIKKND
jgi:hypothetical protein